jgi:hypothetical protein
VQILLEAAATTDVMSSPGANSVEREEYRNSADPEDNTSE